MPRSSEKMKICGTTSVLSLTCRVWFMASFVEASVHEYTGERFMAKGNAYVVHGGSEGIYASTPGSFSDSTIPSNGNSYIRFDKVRFVRNEEHANYTSGPIHAIIFELGDREMIGGSAYGGQRAICCTHDLAKLGMCLQGDIIHRTSTINPDWPQILSVPFNMNEIFATLPSKSVPIATSGMYNLYFIHCDSNLKSISIEGKTIWKNPTGYLPGKMAPLKNFYGFMSLAFVLLGLSWFSKYARYWHEVFPLHNCITIIITLGMLEMSLWYFDYAEFNKSGIRPIGITIWAITFGTVKRTIARVVILLVSMGYGVVRPTLGGLSSKVAILGFTFFAASEMLELVDHVGAVSDVSEKARVFLILPIGILDAFFILWTFKALSSTLNKLQARRMIVKLDVYQKFTNALVVAVLLSVGWVCYELYVKSNDTYNEHWQKSWVISAFWQFYSFSLLCIISTLWAPSKNSTRYAYSGDTSEEFDKDDATVKLIKPSPMHSKDVPSPSLLEVRPINVDADPLNLHAEEDKMA